MKAISTILSTVTLALGLAAHAQKTDMLPAVQPKPLVTRAINPDQRTILQGNVHPMAQAKYDAGAVDDATPTGRLIMTLNRSAEQEAALQQFLSAVHRPGTPQYHQWLTPAQFGAHFGPTDSDVEAATAWLQSQGLKVEGAAAGKTGIVFSGTAGQMRNAFKTELHTYKVNGEVHHANASAPQIPSALAPLVQGITRLNDFVPHSNLRKLGKATYNVASHKVTPSWTTPSGSGGYDLALGPADLRIEYDLSPLYSSGVTGAGQRVGIINDSNIDIDIVAAYRKFFLLDAGGTTPILPTVILDGEDPGINGDAPEAYLDVEMVAAVAPQAAVDLYTSAGSDFTSGLDLSILRAVNDDHDPVLSVSFGECEAGIGGAGMAYYNSIWEEAAAQGQTVFVSTGDSGAAGCDSDQNDVALYGKQVNGLASTPWDIAVGGTDTYYSDYATGGNSFAQYWSQTNDMNHGSLIKPFPEQVWNDSVYGFNLAGGEGISGGSGGQSSCAVPGVGTNPITSTGVADCSMLAGFPKPAWQSGVGVPQDGVRDIPDVSLFAGAGENYSFLAICVDPGDCTSNINPNTGDIVFFGTGGTSAAAPAFAGILSLVNQKFGAQGQANTILYPLAAKMPAIFHDITVGSNNVPCSLTTTPALDCTQDTNSGNFSLHDWPATVGYDLASGLGTVDAAALVNNWNTITFAATATTLQTSSTQVTHGHAVTLTSKVAATSGTSIPSGAVAITGNIALANSASISEMSLDATGTGTESIVSLPGGTYNLTAHYSGDMSFAESQSSPVSVTVAPEPASLNVVVSRTDYVPLPAISTVTSGATVPYGTYLGFNAQVIGANSAPGTLDGIATGTVAMLDNGKQIAQIPLNSTGAIYYLLTTLEVGAHSITFSYAGDPSFQASTSTPFTLTIAKGATQIDYTDYLVPISGGGSYMLLFEVGSSNQTYFGGGLPPTGTLTVQLGNQTQNLTLLPESNGTSTAIAIFSNLQPGNYAVFLSYPGDARWNPFTESGEYPAEVSAPVLPTTTTTLSLVSPAASTEPFLPGAQITMSVQIQGNGTAAPTGDVVANINGLAIPILFPVTPGTGGTSTATVIFPAYDGYTGTNSVVVWYFGDSNYAGSVSNLFNYTANVDDFTLQVSKPILSVVSGKTATVDVLLNSYGGASVAYGGSNTTTINLTCSVSGGPANNKIMPTCSVPASATLTGTGQVTATMTLTTALPLTGDLKPVNPLGAKGLIAVPVSFALLLVCFPWKRRKLPALLIAFVASTFLGLMSGCSNSGSGSGSGSGGSSTQNAPAGTYLVLLNATNGASTHSVPVQVVITTN